MYYGTAQIIATCAQHKWVYYNATVPKYRWIAIKHKTIIKIDKYSFIAYVKN